MPGEQDYRSHIPQWMIENPDLMELYRSGQTDPNLTLDLDQPSPWSLRNNQPTQPVSGLDYTAFRRAFGI